jgi:hypothetical protein
LCWLISHPLNEFAEEESKSREPVKMSATGSKGKKNTWLQVEQGKKGAAEYTSYT